MILKDVEATLSYMENEFRYQGHGISAFARDTELSRGCVANIVNGVTQSPHFKTVIKFMKGLGQKVKVLDHKGKGARKHKLELVA